MAKKKINLALQGGGAHGAYTWGVLDRLLEEEDLIIEGISGTSAGAMNAAVLVNGMARNGVQGAREDLEKFWRRISDSGAFGPMRKMPYEQWFSGWNMDTSPSYHWFDWLSRVYSPYDLNPLNVNPLRGILADIMDFERLRHYRDIHLFITATHVESGQARVFHCHEINTDALLASACIPFIFQAVDIDGEQYWDGGYMGNPALWPLIYHCESRDVVLVQINPIHNEQHPRTAGEIINRLNEITFNSSLIAEMRAIDFVSRLIHDGHLVGTGYKDMRMHLIYSPEHMHNLNASSKMNADWEFFTYLKNMGRQTAEEWLAGDWKQVGKTGTLDIRDKFLRGPGSLRSGPLQKKPQQQKQKQVKQRKKI